MPISKKEWDVGRKWDTLEARILSFLHNNRDKALTSTEIMHGIGYTSQGTDFMGLVGTIASIWTINNALITLVKEGSVKARVIDTTAGEQTYYMAT